ncbi:iron-containing redox enzyme family protein [Pseudomonas solani]|uniref:iron-containing redox enzyme family protein n=1 Tax=Pseudomonas solani TaxID=2731552 RepID=UPI003F4AE5FA
MSKFEVIVGKTKNEYREFVEKNPLLKVVANGEMTKAHYGAYLRETYHLVRHTSRMLALGGARLSDDRRGLRNWFFEQVLEENGHDLFCIKDLKNIGMNPDEVLDSQPSAGAWGLITQNYFMATYGNPVGILGVATATEGLGADFGTIFADIIVEKYGLPTSAVTFLRSHGGFDMKHLEEAVEAIELIHDDEIELVAHARRMTFRFYGQLFQDVLSASETEAYAENLTA